MPPRDPRASILNVPTRRIGSCQSAQYIETEAWHGSKRGSQRRLLWEQCAVVAAALGIAHGVVIGGATGLVALGVLHAMVLPVCPEVATQRLVGFDLCQLLLTTPIRPSTTHHFLELAERLERAPLVAALAWLCRDVARLRSFVREAPLALSPRRWVPSSPRRRIVECR